MEKLRKHFKNKAEQKFLDLMKNDGYRYVRRGYPDFMVLDKEGDIVGFVEVKQMKSDHLREGQERFKRFCKKYNIPFYKWTPDGGFEPSKLI